MRSLTIIAIVMASFLSQSADAKSHWCGKHRCHTEVKHVPVPVPRPQLASLPEIVTDLPGPRDIHSNSVARSISVILEKEIDWTRDQGTVAYIAPWQNALGWDAQKIISSLAFGQKITNDGRGVLAILMEKFDKERRAAMVYPTSELNWSMASLDTPAGMFFLLIGAIITASGLLHYFDTRLMAKVRVKPVRQLDLPNQVS